MHIKTKDLWFKIYVVPICRCRFLLVKISLLLLKNVGNQNHTFLNFIIQQHEGYNIGYETFLSNLELFYHKLHLFLQNGLTYQT